MYMYRMSLEQRIKERERIHDEIADRDRVVISNILREIIPLKPTSQCKVLDFGCGQGIMVDYLHSLGYDAYGCDIIPAREEKTPTSISRLALISTDPYRLPYADNMFDIVFSTSVLEHAQNTEECFKEIYRILKVGGASMHYFPSKWYLPSEPHIHIPLANYFWPYCPRWWICLWVLLRVIFIPKLAADWKNIYHRYCAFCKEDVIYLPNRKYHQISMKVFGNYDSLTETFLSMAGGRYAKLARKLPFKKIAAWLFSNLRMNFILQRKEA